MLTEIVLPLSVNALVFQELRLANAQSFLFLTHREERGSELTISPYPPYSKVDRAFFDVQQVKRENRTVGYLFSTTYPVLYLSTSILAYRQFVKQNVKEHLVTASLLLKNPDFLVFGASNACILISSPHAHQNLSDALSSTL